MLGRRLHGGVFAGRRPPRPSGETVEIEEDHGRGVQRQQLAQGQAADDGVAERLADFEPAPVPSMSGTAPSIAAIVVMRIGRKRSTQAW